MKKIFFLAIVLVVGFILVVSLTKDMIAKTAIERGVETATGLKLRMDKLNIGLFNTTVNIENLRLYNPDDYQNQKMLTVPNIYLNYSLPSILRGKIHLHDARFHLGEFTAVKNEAGRLNLDSLKAVQLQKESKDTREKAEKEAFPLRIDRLELRIDKAVYKDYSRAGEPRVREFELGLDQTYYNIKGPYQLVNLIVFEAVANTAIANLTGFDIRGLENQLKESFLDAEDIGKEAIDEIKERFSLPGF